MIRGSSEDPHKRFKSLFRPSEDPAVSRPFIAPTSRSSGFNLQSNKGLELAPISNLDWTFQEHPRTTLLKTWPFAFNFGIFWCSVYHPDSSTQGPWMPNADFRRCSSRKREPPAEKFSKSSAKVQQQFTNHQTRDYWGGTQPVYQPGAPGSLSFGKEPKTSLHFIIE